MGDKIESLIRTCFLFLKQIARINQSIIVYSVFIIFIFLPYSRERLNDQ